MEPPSSPIKQGAILLAQLAGNHADKVNATRAWFFIFRRMPGSTLIRRHAKSGLALWPVASSTNVIFLQVMATFLPNAVLSPMTIPISGRAS